MVDLAILAGVVAAGGVLAWPSLAHAPLWRATITPLASIIGSGFLVLGPILIINFGAYAPLVMLGLCALAYAFGGAIRFNIARIDDAEPRSALAEGIERGASAVLAFAYVISVAYYLNLFGAFGVSLTSVNDAYHARLLTTGVFLVILATGWTRGFSALERMEQVSVGVKLSIIVGLLVGLGLYFAETAQAGKLVLNAPKLAGWQAITLAAGLIVTVQGFETSRYLGQTYDAAMRIRSMKIAQGVSSLIYLLYILLLAYAFDASVMELTETSIIDLMEVVAPILSALLVAAALSAQFSAAVADTSGSGGLFSELSGGRVSPRAAYTGLVVIGLTLTWAADVFQIISYASRAFAVYYAIQTSIAAVSAQKSGQSLKAVLFAAISVVAALATVFGTAVE